MTKLFFLNILLIGSIELHSYAQGNMNEPKPDKRAAEYQGRGSGAYVQDLRKADNEFDEGSYADCSVLYLKYLDSLDKDQHNRLGWLYYKGFGVSKDYSKAKSQFELAAKENCAQSNYYLGSIIFKELKAQSNRSVHSEYLKYFQVAADLGDAEAMNALGIDVEERNYLERHDKKEIKENYRKAAEWYFKAAQSGSTNGMVNLGDCYSEGFGVKKDRDSALMWYRKSASLGNSVAMYNLGNDYAAGKSPLQRNYDSALMWHRLAAENGEAYSMTNLGYMYEHGQGVPVDFDEAMRWYQKGVDGGDPYAARNIGHMYNYGTGVKKDVEKAMIWYKKADSLHLYVLDKDK